MASIDILMITYNRPEYTEMALKQLLATCDDDMRVWIWQNGSDPATLEFVKSMLDHPRIHKFHHSEENKRLNEPTNWLWENATGDFVTKVDDDCLMPEGWADTLRAAFRDEPKFGVLGCWRFPEEDFVPEVANKKIKEFSGGHQIMQNCWVEGSGYLMRTDSIRKYGLLKPNDSFPRYCIRLAQAGWINGWYFPFLFQEHMDDPRSEHCELKSDEDFKRRPPLMAQRWGTESLEQWSDSFRREAYLLQDATIDPRHYSMWRARMRGIYQRIRSFMGSSRKG